MARAKIKRGSTSVDMTPMCDVAFLLLTFFILAAQFKPPSAIEVVTPSSVSNKVAPQKDYLTVTIDKYNKVYLDMDPKLKDDILDEIGRERNITFTPLQKKQFEQAAYIGTPISGLTQFDNLTPEQLKATTQPGIPVDSSNDELSLWIGAAKAVRMGENLSYLIKGDDAAKYTTFSKVIEAFKKNDEFKYYLLTSAKELPVGSELYKKDLEEQKEGKKSEK